jgi:hypothetical protein
MKFIFPYTTSVNAAILAQINCHHIAQVSAAAKQNHSAKDGTTVTSEAKM